MRALDPTPLGSPRRLYATRTCRDRDTSIESTPRSWTLLGHQTPASVPDTPRRAPCRGCSRSDPSSGRVCGVLARGVPRRLRRHAAPPPEPIAQLTATQNILARPSLSEFWRGTSGAAGDIQGLPQRPPPRPRTQPPTASAGVRWLPYSPDILPTRPPPRPQTSPPYVDLPQGHRRAPLHTAAQPRPVPSSSRRRGGHDDRFSGVSVGPWGSPGATPPRRGRAPTSPPLGTGGLESKSIVPRTSTRPEPRRDHGGTCRGIWSPGPVPPRRQDSPGELRGPGARGASSEPSSSHAEAPQVPQLPEGRRPEQTGSEDPGERSASRGPPATLREPPVVLPRRRRAARAPHAWVGSRRGGTDGVYKARERLHRGPRGRRVQPPQGSRGRRVARQRPTGWLSELAAAGGLVEKTRDVGGSSADPLSSWRRQLQWVYVVSDRDLSGDPRLGLGLAPEETNRRGAPALSRVWAALGGPRPRQHRQAPTPYPLPRTKRVDIRPLNTLKASLSSQSPSR